MSAEPVCPYIPGASVVPRTWYPEGGKKGRRRPLYGWTLHLDSCPYASRSTTKMPAPSTPYPGTVACTTCKPEGGDHVMTTSVVDGKCQASCTCGAVGTGVTYDSARSKVYRIHNIQRRATGVDPIRRKPGARRKPTNKAKAPKGPSLSFTYNDEPDGRVRATCAGCGRSDVGPNKVAARVRGYRSHQAAGGCEKAVS